MYVGLICINCIFNYSYYLFIMQATKSSELPSKESEGVKKLIDELPLVTKLKELNSSLTSIEVLISLVQ